VLEKLLLTGAAGGLATLLRPHLSGIARQVVLSDIVDITDLAPHERFVACDVSDYDAVTGLFDGVDGVIHLGGVSIEKPWEMILKANIEGAYNIFEAARHNGQPRIIFASSNHAIGYYRREERLDSRSVPKPDTLYGLSKAFGENLASLYYDKFGQECLAVRIGSCFDKPKNPRMLATWMAVEDFADLVARTFAAPRLAYTIVYGASANDESWWDNRDAAFLGWTPKHTSAKWRAEVMDEAAPEAPTDPAVIYQGGAFVALGHPDDEA